MTGKLRYLLAFLLFVALNCPGQTQASPLPGVPESRFDHLRHGINLSHWFGQSPTGTYDAQRLTTYITARDFDLIKSMGFDHVRLTLEPAQLLTPSQPDKLEPQHLKLLDDAVQMVLSHGLAVIIDIHPSGDFNRKLATDQRQVEAFTDFWRSLARHYSDTDPERVFFEVLNEPEMGDGYRWYGMEAQFITIIRSVAPRHTIIASGHNWSGLSDLLALEPFADPNVVYNFHYYDPATFTHQGATWGMELWHHLPRVHYPSHPGADANLIQSLPLFTQKIQLVHYDQDRWGPERIDADMSMVAAWAAAHHVRVTCNEFGVFRNFADPDERAAWIHDVRTSLEKHDIGWTMWDYADTFGVVTGDPGKRVPDERVLKALGLK